MDKNLKALIIIGIIMGASLGFLVVFYLYISYSNYFSNELGWIWMSGSTTIDVNGIYGTNGVPSPANLPGGRYGAVSWMDSNDNLWLFGGEGYSESGEKDLLNDLWKFDGVTWTWMSGNKTTNINGVYGTKGVPSPLNYPGSREGAVSWTDSSNNLWLFGGDGYPESGGSGDLNDLWKFDGENWTWISGSKSLYEQGVYGTRGVPDAANHPGSRNYAVSWIDSDDNLWLFGGEGLPESGFGWYLNDLWKFDGVNWTWISGNKTTASCGIYGIKGIPNAENYPGSRSDAVSWIDSDDNLWLFSGIGYSTSSSKGSLNDLWKFNGANWTWVSGHKILDLNGVHGIKYVPDQANFPGSRYGAVSWIDSQDNLWLFGGFGYPEFGVSGELKDLWKFDGSTWTWLSGKRILNFYENYGVYGIKGVLSMGNIPGARRHAISWTDSDDNLWLFGGRGYAGSVREGILNDLWKYDTNLFN
ncbi:MAG: Kelch repeat-containing protein [Promethearchaeota archaeon]